MAGYIGSKAVLLSTTAAEVSGDADIGGSLLVDTIKSDSGTTAATIDNSGNVALSGTFGVTGASTFSGGIANSGTISAGTLASAVVMAAGSVVQVIHGHTTTQVTETSNTSLSSPTDSGLAATITPKFSSSKILVCVDASLRGDGGTAWANLLIKRGGTLIDYSACSDDGILGYSINHTSNQSSWKFYDSPSTTSSTEYRIFFSRYGGSGTAAFNVNGNHYALSTITLMEIKQ